MAAIQTIHPGRILLAAALCGLGILTACYGDFALQWQPVPHSLPAYPVLAYASAVLLIGLGIGLALKLRLRVTALLLVGYLVLFWLLPQLLRLLPAASSIGAWLGFCEVLGVTCGALLLSAEGADPRIRRIARALFGACCIVYGVSHFVYAGFTAAMIPHWLPQRLSLAYITGAGHVLAGIAILFDILPSLAALLEALMMSLFVLLLHVPSLWANPSPEWAPTLRTQITPLFWALALAASAWLVYDSLRRTAPYS